MESSNHPTSPFLRLPAELRLQIYEECLPSGAITISSAEITSYPHVHVPIPGLPSDHVPVIKAGYDEQLLISNLSTQFSGNPICQLPRYRYRFHGRTFLCTGWQEWPGSYHNSNGSGSSSSTKPVPNSLPDAYPSTFQSLLLTSRLVHSEVRDIPTRRPLDLYLSFPAGVCVLVHCFPSLLKHSRVVRIYGVCDLTRVEIPRGAQAPGDPWEQPDPELISFAPPRRVRTDPRWRTTQIAQTQVESLRKLIGFLLGQGAAELTPLAPRDLAPPTAAADLKAKPPSSAPLLPPPPPRGPYMLEDLTLRVFHPQAATHDIYPAIWSHELSPVTQTLGSICGGRIKLSCTRGRKGTGVEIVARGNKFEGRCLVSKWPRMEEGKEWNWGVRGWGSEEGRRGCDWEID